MEVKGVKMNPCVHVLTIITIKKVGRHLKQQRPCFVFVFVVLLENAFDIYSCLMMI